MDTKQIQDLIEIVSRSDLESLEFEGTDFKLRLVKAAAPVAPAPAPALPAPVSVEAEGVVQHVPAAAAPVPAAAPAAAAPAADPGLVDFTSPIVGTFYSAPTPGTPAFVEVGERVSKGKVLCIIEAMKVMNEIESEFDAEVAEVVAADGQPVGFGEVLFRLKRLGGA